MMSDSQFNNTDWGGVNVKIEFRRATILRFGASAARLLMTDDLIPGNGE
jgi:hypothetical protein